MTIRILALAGLLAVPGLAIAQMNADDPQQQQQDPYGTEAKPDVGATAPMGEGEETLTGMQLNTEDQKMLFEAKDKFELKGTVEKIEGNHVFVTRKDMPTADLAIVTDQTKVKLDGKQASIQELQPGAEVRAKFQLAGNEPVALEIDAKAAKGMMKKDTQQNQ